MELAQQRLQRILQQCSEKNIDLNKINAVQRHLKDSKMCKSNKNTNFIKLLVSLGVILYCTRYYYNKLQTRRCALELPRAISYALRPPEHCDFCANIEQVDRVHGISSDEFESKYAYSGAPVIVEDATKNWTALTKFDYWYFRDVYKNAKRKQKILDCQFLPYKTGFKDIYEALDMPAARVNLAAGEAPWYFGWSNCNSETAEEFRRHYGRPYFLPASAENNAVDWFFIGTAGLGAHMHIDNVRLPSWQAQLAGSKRWLLVPPPECYLQCKRFDVVVKQGDMIVLDTNKWYHQTFVEPGVVSLTIGAEYD